MKVGWGDNESYRFFAECKDLKSRSGTGLNAAKLCWSWTVLKSGSQMAVRRGVPSLPFFPQEVNVICLKSAVENGKKCLSPKRMRNE